MTKLMPLLCKVIFVVGLMYQTIQGMEQEAQEIFILDGQIVSKPTVCYEMPKNVNICISFQGCEFPSHVIIEQKDLLDDKTYRQYHPLNEISPPGQYDYLCVERLYPGFVNNPCQKDNDIAMLRVPHMVSCNTSHPFRMYVEYINKAKTNIVPTMEHFPYFMLLSELLPCEIAATCILFYCQSNTYYDAYPIMLLGHDTLDIDVFNHERNQYIQGVRIAQWKKLPAGREVNPNGYLTLTALERYDAHPLERLLSPSAHKPFGPIWCPRNHIFPRLSRQHIQIIKNITKLEQLARSLLQKIDLTQRLAMDVTLKKAYEEVKKSAPPKEDEYNISIITVTDQKKAEEIIKDLRESGISKFAEVADAKSLNTIPGGNLGYVRLGELPEALREKINNASKETLVSSPVEMSLPDPKDEKKKVTTYNVIYVQDKRSSVLAQEQTIESPERLERLAVSERQNQTIDVRILWNQIRNQLEILKQSMPADELTEKKRALEEGLPNQGEIGEQILKDHTQKQKDILLPSKKESMVRLPCFIYDDEILASVIKKFSNREEGREKQGAIIEDYISTTTPNQFGLRAYLTPTGVKDLVNYFCQRIIIQADEKPFWEEFIVCSRSVQHLLQCTQYTNKSETVNSPIYLDDYFHNHAGEEAKALMKRLSIEGDPQCW